MPGPVRLGRLLAFAVLCLSWVTPACRGASSGPPAPYDRSCEADGDCTPAPSCCPAPCTENVINQRESARAQRELVCEKKEPCPQAGSCRTHAYLCVEKTCKLVFEGTPGWRTRQP